MDDRNETNRYEKIVEIAQVSEVDTVFPITVMMRPYFSSYHLWAARHFSVLAGNAEPEEGTRSRFDIKHRAYVTNSIFSAVAFMEAAINELFQDIADGHESYVATLGADSKQLMCEFLQLTEQRNRSVFNLLDKYQIALTFLRKHQFTPGHQPYQDAALVVKLRNELVHYKPRSLGGDVEHTLVQHLARKFPDNKLMSSSGNPWFPDKCLGHGCTEWSIRAVGAYADEFFNRIGVVPNYQRIQFQPSPSEV